MSPEEELAVIGFGQPMIHETIKRDSFEPGKAAKIKTTLKDIMYGCGYIPSDHELDALIRRGTPGAIVAYANEKGIMCPEISDAIGTPEKVEKNISPEDPRNDPSFWENF